MNDTDRVLFVVGGARSGKSDLAVRLGRGHEGPVLFLATATAGDGDMAERIRRHQAERPSHWATSETPIEITAAIDDVDDETLLILDCLTLWTSNLLLADRSESEVTTAAEQLAAALGSRGGRSIVVSNEVGLGVHPPSELGRLYRDVLGRVNRIVATAADRTLFLVAGKAFELDDPIELLNRPRSR